ARRFEHQPHGSKPAPIPTRSSFAAGDQNPLPLHLSNRDADCHWFADDLPAVSEIAHPTVGNDFRDYFLCSGCQPGIVFIALFERGTLATPLAPDRCSHPHSVWSITSNQRKSGEATIGFDGAFHACASGDDRRWCEPQMGVALHFVAAHFCF